MKLKKFIYIIPLIVATEAVVFPELNTQASGSPVLRLRANKFAINC